MPQAQSQVANLIANLIDEGEELNTCVLDIASAQLWCRLYSAGKQADMLFVWPLPVMTNCPGILTVRAGHHDHGVGAHERRGGADVAAGVAGAAARGRGQLGGLRAPRRVHRRRLQRPLLQVRTPAAAAKRAAAE